MKLHEEGDGDDDKGEDDGGVYGNDGDGGDDDNGDGAVVIAVGVSPTVASKAPGVNFTPSLSRVTGSSSKKESRVMTEKRLMLSMAP